MAGIDRKGKDNAGIPGNGAGIMPWSLRNNGGSGEGITPSNGAAAGVTPNVKVYQADAGATVDIDCKQQLATTSVYPNNGPGALKDGSVGMVDNAIVGNPNNPQYMGWPQAGAENHGDTSNAHGVTQPAPIKGNANQYSELGE